MTSWCCWTRLRPAKLSLTTRALKWTSSGLSTSATAPGSAVSMVLLSSAAVATRHRVAVAILREVMAQEVTYKAQGISFTDVGAQKVQEFLASQGEVAVSAGLRVGVKGGGCSGFQYQLAFDEQKDGDV